VALTDDEQIFGLVREILYIKENPVYFRSFCSAGCVSAFYIITSTLNSKLRLFYRPLSMRVALYMIAGFFIYGIHSLAQDFCQVKVNWVQTFYYCVIFQVSLDGEIDEKLATLTKEFLEAGVRFYEKLLKKNIAIRELSGDDSEFTAMGKLINYCS
jgi:hypothetical protein